MSFQAVFILTPYILSALISMWMGILAARRRSVPGALLFAGVAFCEVIWTVGYVFQLLSTDLGGKLLWNNIQFFGAIGVPLAVLGFALEYDRDETSIWSRVSWKLFALPALLLLAFIWTDGLHHLFRGPVGLVAGDPFSRLAFPDGPGFAFYTIFAYSLLVLMILVLFPRYLRAEQLYRLQIGVVLVGILIPWVTTVVTALGLVAARLHDITPITFGFSNLVIAWALFRYHLFEVLPAARDFLVEHMQEGVLVADYRLCIIDVNPAAERILGIQEIKSLGRSILSIRPFTQDQFAGVPSGGSLKTEVLIQRADFEGIYELQITLLNNPRGRAAVYLMILRDIRDRKHIEEKLNYLAITDSLTQVYNRRHVIFRAGEEIERARETGRELALILIDVDHFKTVNDTCGHQMGDQVLQSMAERCQSVLRSQDIFGRYGGEEFLVVLPEADTPTAMVIAERLRAQVEGLALPVDRGIAPVTISLGISCSGACEDFDLDKMLDWADQALYRAKAEGRNRVCVFQPWPIQSPSD